MTADQTSHPGQTADSGHSIDPALFREVMGHYPTGVVLVTGVHPDGEELAAIMGTFTSVSLDPPLVAFLPMKNSRSFLRLQECESMCINVLTGDQEAVSRAIATRRENKFEGLTTYRSPSGDPVLAGSLAWIDVRLHDVIDAGDHWIAMCRVIDLHVDNPTGPLIFFQGGYGRFTIPSLIARMEEDLVAPIQQAHRARAELEQLANRFGCEAALLAEVSPDELATVASATAPDKSVEASLGTRVPMVPPLGDMFIAAKGPEAEERWLGKALTSEVRDQAQDRVRFARRAGYSLSFLPEDDANPYREMVEATRLWSKGGLTPAQERQVRESVAQASVCYHVRELEPEKRYDIGSVVVPIVSKEGHVVHILRMSQLPRRSSGQEIRVWIETLRAAARRIGANLTLEGPPAP